MEKTEDDINKLIKDGLDTIEKLIPETGVTAGCGACRFLIQSMIDDSKSHRSNVSLQDGSGSKI